MRRLVVIFVGPLLLSNCSKSHEPIQCPTAETGRLDGTIRETPTEIEAAGRTLAQGSDNEIAKVASGVRLRHPKVSKAEVINYLITAYCPIVNAERGPAATAKQQELQAFAKRAERIVH